MSRLSLKAFGVIYRYGRRTVDLFEMYLNEMK